MTFKFYNKTVVLVLFTLLILTNAQAQIEIKSKVDLETYSNYSKSIDLFEKMINPNDVLTIFIASNEGLDRLVPSVYNSVFVNKSSNDILIFKNQHTISEYITITDFNNPLISNTSVVKQNNAGSNLAFTKNPPYVMITDFSGYESNIMSSISINSHIILHFISGAIKY